MEILWTPWRYSYIAGEGRNARPGVPVELEHWPGLAQAPDREQDHRPAPKLETLPECVFCNLIASVDWAIAEGMAADEADRAGLILGRTPHSYLCLNRFPYNSGHVLIVPRRHEDGLIKLSPVEASDVMLEAQRVERALRVVYQPDGLNLGMNLGKAAGAGVAAHLHLHLLPRWVGDTNFMSVTAETRVLPETLETTWARVRDALNKE